MAGQIVVERIEFRGRCGVTSEERARPQPLAVDLELDCEMGQAGLSDDLRQTVDYAAVVHRIVETGTDRETQLLETMAEQLLLVIFQEFPVDRIKLWLRKLSPPITHVTRSVGITIERTRLEQQMLRAHPPPAKFLGQQLHRLPTGTVLDVAAGRGRHTLFLASLGYHVEAIDRDEQALTELLASARSRNLTGVTTRTLDLEAPPLHAPSLGHRLYDAVLVFFYLSRPLFPHLLDALKPGGVLLYETFLMENHFQHHHPKRQEFCLAPGELLDLTSALRVLHYDEGPHEGAHGGESVFTAQLVAQKPFASGTTI